jgi:hypothetical protein
LLSEVGPVGIEGCEFTPAGLSVDDFGSRSLALSRSHHRTSEKEDGHERVIVTAIKLIQRIAQL